MPPPLIEKSAPVAPPAGAPVSDASPDETPQAEQPAERIEPVLSARDESDGEDSGGGTEKSETAGEPDEAESPGEETGPDGLTEKQRAKLTAARQQKPGRRLWINVLMVLAIVAGVLFVALRMLPPDVLRKINPASEQPADIGEVEAMPAPANPETGGHIVGGEPPAKPAQ
jgi:hypothetical protein